MKTKSVIAMAFVVSPKNFSKAKAKLLTLLLLPTLSCYTLKSTSKACDAATGLNTVSSNIRTGQNTANDFYNSFFNTSTYLTTASNEPKNIIKINLSALVFKNISLQYERVLKRRMSLALGIAIMPKIDLPFKQTLMDEFGTNADAKRAIETTMLSNFSITPEIRFYAGKKGAPAGFYVAPFLRYNHMNFEQLYEFTASDGKLYHPFITGTINNFGGGILLGAQWHLGKRLTFDWWIAGPSYGTLNGDLSGTDDMSEMSAADKQKLERDIEDVDLPLIKTDATVGNNRVDVKLSGSYVGLRTVGFAFGYKF